MENTESSDETESHPDVVLNAYNDSMAKIASLSDARVESLESRLQSDWASASENEKARWEKHVDEACRAVCRVIAPKASCELLAAYRKSSVPGKAENEPRTQAENALVAAYQNAPMKSLKTQILSIYAPKYTAKELKLLHSDFEQLSDRQIKKAKAHAKTLGAGQILPKIIHHRTRIDLSKLNHFLTFADQPYFYQDVSYGTRMLKLQSGEQIMMPNIVRTVTRSTMIEQYFKHCSDDDFEPLGRSTLFQILKVRESSQRKSLQGLDNIAASGADGFDMLHKIVNDLEQFGSERAGARQRIRI